MRKLFRILTFQLLLAFSCFIYVAHGQISVEYGLDITPEQMVEKILGDGIAYSNVSYQGGYNSRGIFSWSDSTNMGITAGIFFTSGVASDIPGPNSSYSTGTDVGQFGDTNLTAIATGVTYDAAVLEFDFIPETDTLRFKYTFGSDEYNESVGTSNNDIFGLFVTGPNPEGGDYSNKNIAIVPETDNIPISINTINNGWASGGSNPTGPCENCEYFIDNSGGQSIEFDGLTTVLTAWLPVVPCEEYHLKIGVADVSDKLYDSGVLIEENSIEFPKIEHETILDPPGLSDDLIEGHVAGDLIFKLPNASYSPVTIDFEVGGTADPSAFPDGDFEEEIPTSVYFGSGLDTAFIHLEPVGDGIIEGPEFLDLILENSLGCTVRYDTVSIEIIDFINMVTNTSQNTMICAGQQIELWVDVYNGFPPYTYSWEPGNYTTETILVSPDVTTMYTVSCQDIFLLDTVVDSVLVTVLPLNYEIFSFSFEKINNPDLPFDIIGEIFEDSISLDVPLGTNLTNLVASYYTSDSAAWLWVNGVPQESGQTPNDFTNPVIYQAILLTGGCSKEWIVNVNLVTEYFENSIPNISVLPNPASDRLTIRNAKGFELAILNGLGQKLLSKKLRSDFEEINIHKLNEGIYFLNFKNSQRLFTKKVIVER